jgi:hypothetical protein
MMFFSRFVRKRQSRHGVCSIKETHLNSWTLDNKL